MEAAPAGRFGSILDIRAAKPPALPKWFMLAMYRQLAS